MKKRPLTRKDLEYYAKMAAAWLLSLCYVKFKNETNNLYYG